MCNYLATLAHLRTVSFQAVLKDKLVLANALGQDEVNTNYRAIST